MLEGASGGAVASMMAAVKQNGKSFRGSMVAGPGGSPLLTPLLEALLGWPQARLMGGMGVDAAVSMAKAARQLFGSDVGLGITSMAIDDGVYPDGTVWVAAVSEEGEIQANSDLRNTGKWRCNEPASSRSSNLPPHSTQNSSDPTAFSTSSNGARIGGISFSGRPTVRLVSCMSAVMNSYRHIADDLAAHVNKCG